MGTANNNFYLNKALLMNLSPSLRMDTGQPNQTLYIQNLNEKVPLVVLREGIKTIFNNVDAGVVQVWCKSCISLRGQAFVQCVDVESARKALSSLQGTRVFGKSMLIKFAKYKTDAVSKADGTFEIERRRREQDQSMYFGRFCCNFVVERSRQPRLTRRQLLAQMAANPIITIPPPMLMGMPHTQALPLSTPQMINGDLQIPNKVLYLQNIPIGTTEAMLTALFKPFPGFAEIRLVPTRPDVAFLEYDTEAQASIAREATDKREIGDGLGTISVTFARR